MPFSLFSGYFCALGLVWVVYVCIYVCVLREFHVEEAWVGGGAEREGERERSRFLADKRIRQSGGIRAGNFVKWEHQA